MKCFTPPPPRGSWDSRLSTSVVAAIAAFIALAALLSACANSEPPGDSDDDPDIPSAISHSARVDADNGQIVYVSVSLSAPARVAVEYENEYAGKFRTALSETAAEHLIPVVRLRARTAYQYAIGVEKGDGTFAYPARGEFTTGGIPGILAGMRSKTSGRSSQDLIMADYQTKTSEGWRQSVVMMDALGFAVWNYSPAVPDKMNRVRVPPNGNVMLQLGYCCIVEATPLGEAVNEFAANRAHHDFLPLEDGRILYIGNYHFAFDDSANGGDAERNVLIDAIIALDPASGERERVWDPLDFWDIGDISQWGARNPKRDDWLHMNSLSESPGGGYIVSLRNLNQVASLSSDFKTVRWRLGGPDSDFAFPNPADRFTAQHTAAELPNGNILVFDNKAALPEEEGGGNYSRALELRLDFESMTAVKAWEFSPNPRMYSSILGSAYRLDNGNTLVNFGRSADPAVIPIAIIEADAQGLETFKLETIDPPLAESALIAPRRYRAYPGPKSIMGETMLRPPKRR